jgi:hypothetical protein
MLATHLTKGFLACHERGELQGEKVRARDVHRDIDLDKDEARTGA